MAAALDSRTPGRSPSRRGRMGAWAHETEQVLLPPAREMVLATSFAGARCPRWRSPGSGVRVEAGDLAAGEVAALFLRRTRRSASQPDRRG
jgi:hypothetical protein